ncbi:MAG: TIR domain-containing protein [Bacteroidota bacterium]
MTRVFISYVVEDDAYKDKLQKNLRVLIRQGWLDAWDQEQINVGEDRQRLIQQQLEEADLMLLLISPDYLASEYIFDVELKRIMERSDSTEDAVKVIPIILRPCDWTNETFATKEVLPPEARPLSTWENEDEAYLSINEGIKQILNLKPNESLAATPQSVAVTTDQPENRAILRETIDKGQMNTAFDLLRQHLQDADAKTYSQYIYLRGRQARLEEKLLKKWPIHKEEQEGIVQELSRFLNGL